MYDAHWVSYHQQWLDTNLAGCVTFADCHYWMAQDTVKKMVLMAPLPKTIKPRNNVVKLGSLRMNVNSPMFQRGQTAILNFRGNVERAVWNNEANFQVIEPQIQRWFWST